MGQHEQLFCSLDAEGGPGMGGAGLHGIRSYQPPAPPGEDHSFRAGDGRTTSTCSAGTGWAAPRVFSPSGTRRE